MLLLILISIFSIWMFHNLYWKRKGLPPGPTPLPIFGNTFALGKLGYSKFFMDIKKKYGDIHTFWLGNSPVVSINDVPTIMETFVKDGETYSGRPVDSKIVELMRFGRNGLIFTDGPLWREHRRFALHVLRDFGMGKNLMQEKVLDEVAILIENMKRKAVAGEKEISIQDAIDIGVGSIINNLLFGYSFSKENKQAEFYQLKGYLSGVVREVGNPFVRFADRNPIIFKCFPSVYKGVTKATDVICEFFMGQMKAHKENINLEDDNEPTDYVEAFMKKRHQLEKEGITDHTFTDNQLYGACLDLWLAGQETTSNTLSWLVIYLVVHPEVQKSLHEELDRVIGSDRYITLDDKARLPYTNAVVAETQRVCNLVPMNVNHRLVKDTVIKGYTIPANTTILHQISTVMQDERYFPEPEKFKPERFIDKDGKFFQPFDLMPFGVGKRSCLGEGLARLELYLFAANIFNHFEVVASPSRPPNTTRIEGGTVQPEPYVVQLRARY